jgi:hypothetical protein
MISDVSGKLLGQFAECLAGRLGEAEGGAAADTAGAAAADTAGPAAADTDPPAATDAAATPVTTAVEEPAEAEAVDLLRVVGGTATARKTAVYGLGAVLLAVLAWVVIRVLRGR